MRLPIPEKIPEGEEWFWTEDWQAGEAAAEADYIAGRSKTYTFDELVEELTK